MKPPLCYLCMATLSTKRQFFLVNFKKEKDQKDMPPGYLGHPPNQVWFCKDHYKYPETQKHLPFSLAKGMIKSDWEKNKQMQGGRHRYRYRYNTCFKPKLIN